MRSSLGHCKYHDGVRAISLRTGLTTTGSLVYSPEECYCLLDAMIMRLGGVEASKTCGLVPRTRRLREVAEFSVCERPSHTSYLICASLALARLLCRRCNDSKHDLVLNLSVPHAASITAAASTQRSLSTTTSSSRRQPVRWNGRLDAGASA